MHDVSHHVYADDIQVYIELSQSDTHKYISSLSDCFTDISLWMKSSKLKLNSDKKNSNDTNSLTTFQLNYLTFNSILHSAGPAASGLQLMGRTGNFVTSRPFWPASLCLSCQSSAINRVVTCHRLDTTIGFAANGQKHHRQK